MGNKSLSSSSSSSEKSKQKKKDYTKLTEEEVILLLANTSFTREEIYQWHAGFIRDCPKGTRIITFISTMCY